jgi:hypothetical protein
VMSCVFAAVPVAPVPLEPDEEGCGAVFEPDEEGCAALLGGGSAALAGAPEEDAGAWFDEGGGLLDDGLSVDPVPAVSD